MDLAATRVGRCRADYLSRVREAVLSPRADPKWFLNLQKYRQINFVLI